MSLPVFAHNKLCGWEVVASELLWCTVMVLLSTSSRAVIQTMKHTAPVSPLSRARTCRLWTLRLEQLLYTTCPLLSKPMDPKCVA